MNIRPAIFWRACTRSRQATTLAIGEPSSSKAITRIEGSRFASHSAAATTTDSVPPTEKGKDKNQAKNVSNDKKKPSNVRQNGRRKKKTYRPRYEVGNVYASAAEKLRQGFSDKTKANLRAISDFDVIAKAAVEERAKRVSKDNIEPPSGSSQSSETHRGTLNPIPSQERFQEYMKRVTARETSENERVLENWEPEPWSTGLQSQDKVNDNRKYPPHHTQEKPRREGRNVANDGLKARPVLVDVVPKTKHQPVDELSHGLDRVLFNPGVHWLQDPRSHVYNFTPWLEKIPKVNDFAFERLTGFVRSSRDSELRALATQEGKKFAGSTSSLSGMLSHIHFLITRFKQIDCSILSQHFTNEPTTFTPGQKMPAMIMLNHKDGIYAIDSYSSEWEDPDKNVLTWMGTLLENFLTKTPDEFNTFMRLESAPPSALKEEPALREAYRYSKSDKFVMRSQLDCHDSRLPGTGVFDIKTRACVSVRMDILNYEENAGYLIKTQHGILESFEKEYYDLIRSAFLKYSFQVRIGNMDGVFVAYHNTERIFGFQYISLDEMDKRLLGANPGIGDKLFNHCVSVLEAILEEATACFPGQSVLCLMETALPGKYLDVFVQPGEWDGDESDKPMKQLRVVVENELDGHAVSPDAALMSTTEKWAVNYKITILDLPDYLIKDNYNTILQRKKRTLVLPSSVTLEEAEKYWTNLNFGNKIMDARLQPFNPNSFSLAQESVERYRRLARQGRLETKAKEDLLAGRPKIVYGHGEYVAEESPFFQKPLEPEDPSEIEKSPETEKCSEPETSFEPEKASEPEKVSEPEKPSDPEKSSEPEQQTTEAEKERVDQGKEESNP